MDLRQNLIDRANIKVGCDASAEKRAAAIALCKKDILSFFQYWLWTFDPRQAEKDIQFVPWPYQEKFITELNSDIEKGISQLTEKSRDMGVTWMVLAVFLYRFLFFNESFLVGSRKEELVDKIGDMDAHFERIRYMLDKLPNWMLEACEFDRKNDNYMKLYKANGASIIGESMNQDFSRQGRYKAILLDEFAFVERAVNVWRACGDSAPCKVVISTPNGSNNQFAVLRKSGKIKVITIHWKLHPFKDDEWYSRQVSDRSDKDIAQEIDINYTISAGDPFYRGFSRALHLRKMNISRERPLVPSWDYGFNHPNCSLHQMSAEGIWIIVDNIFGENQTIDEFGEYVKSYLNSVWPGYVFKGRGYGDPAGKQSSDKSRKSSEQILNELGFTVTSIPSNLPYTNYAARKTIIEKKLRTLIGGIPSLVVNDVPGNMIIVEGFEGGYRFPDANKYGGVAEKPVEDGFFEHPMNTIEYYAVNTFRPVERSRAEENARASKYRRSSYDRPVNAGFAFSGGR
jgi:hypothetical protein